MQTEQVIEEFKEALRRAELTPRDISPLIGLAHTSIYRAMAGREAVSKHILCSFRILLKFLKWYTNQDHEPEETLAGNFELWLQQ